MSEREYVPRGHSEQSSARPSVGLNVPGGHCSHSVWPCARWYHPAGHSTHVFEPARYCALPGGHGSHRHEFQRICFPLVLSTALGSHTRHCAPGQHPLPRPPPARHPSSL